MAAEHVERIGARIRERRDELGLSRRQVVARMEGVASENDLYRWERGQHRPHDDKLEAIARALDVDAAFFLSTKPRTGTPDLLAAFGEPGLDQLDRIERKLDAVLGHLGVSDPAELLEQELADAAQTASARVPGSGRGARARTRAGR